MSDTRRKPSHPPAAHAGLKLGLAGLIAMLGSAVFLLATADDSWPDQSGVRTASDFRLALMTRIPGFGDDETADEDEANQLVGLETASAVKPDFSKDRPRFIVRFRNQPDLEKAMVRYRKDQPAAEAAYSAWASSHKDIQQFQLAGATYSGEAILEYIGDAEINPASGRAIAKALSEHPDISYADPDFSAKPGSSE